MTDLIVEPCGPVLGAEVRGLSIGAEGPSEASAVTLRALLNEHKVLFFRDLELSHQQHLGLGRVWPTTGRRSAGWSVSPFGAIDQSDP